MPVFELACKKCRKIYEKLFKTSDEARDHPPCEVCKTPMEYVYSSPGGYRIKGDNSGSLNSKGKNFKDVKDRSSTYDYGDDDAE